MTPMYLAQVPGVTGPNATGQVNFNVTHQTLDGFGASGAWYESDSCHPRQFSSGISITYSSVT